MYLQAVLDRISAKSSQALGLCLLLLSPMAFGQVVGNLDLNGIGSYGEFGKTNMIVKLEETTTDTVSLPREAVVNRFSFRLYETKTVRRWGQFWSQNLSLNNSVDSIKSNFEDLLKMSEVLPNTLEAGDLIELEKLVSGTTRMRLNEIVLTEFESSTFYEFMQTALMGSIPPSSHLKEQLLGMHPEENAEHIAEFDGLAFTPARQGVIRDMERAARDLERQEAEALAAAIAAEKAAELAAAKAAEDAARAAAARAAAAAKAAAEAPAETAAATGQQGGQNGNQGAGGGQNGSQNPGQGQQRGDGTGRGKAKREAEAAAKAALEAQNRDNALQAMFADRDHVQSIISKVYGNLEYPRSAIRNQQTGTARVQLTLNRDGTIAESVLVESTDFDDLNEAALEGVAKSAPFDPVPASIESDQMVVQIPVKFELND